MSLAALGYERPRMSTPLSLSSTSSIPLSSATRMVDLSPRGRSPYSPFDVRPRPFRVQTTHTSKPKQSPVEAARARRYEDYCRDVPAVRIQIHVPSRHDPAVLVKLNALLDSGSTHNWIGLHVVPQLLAAGHILDQGPSESVHGANAQVTRTAGTLFSNLSMILPASLPGVDNHECQFSSDMRTMKMTDDDIIIGIPTLHSLGLLPLMGEIYVAGRLASAGSAFVDIADPVTLVSDDTPDVTDDMLDNWEPDVIMGSTNHCRQVTINPDAPAVLQSGIESLIEQYAENFGPLPPEGAKLPTFPINTTARPRGRPPYRQPEAAHEEIAKQVQKYLELGICAMADTGGLDWPATSPVLAMKSDSTWRFCIDMSPTNAVTVPYDGPIPDPRELLETIASKKFYCKLDFASAYHQAFVAPEDQKKTAFRTRDGLFYFKRCPFGLRNMPAWWSAQMRDVFQGLPVSIYIDDMVYGADTEEELLRITALVFERCKLFSIRLKASKCEFALTEFEYLGHVVNSTSKRLSDERKYTMAQLKVPKDLAELRIFLGMANYFHDFVPDYANIVKPLTSVCSVDAKRKSNYSWGAEQQLAFDAVKRGIANSATLAFQTKGTQLVLRTDASMVGLGAVLVQRHDDGREEPITFISKAFSATEQRWSTYEQEAYGIVYSVHRLRRYLLGRHFTVETDHRNLIWMDKAESPKVIRWRLSLQQYDFNVTHIPGKTNMVADALSRLCGVPLPMPASGSGAASVPTLGRINLFVVAKALSLLCTEPGGDVARSSTPPLSPSAVASGAATPPTVRRSARHEPGDWLPVPELGLSSVFSPLPLTVECTLADCLSGSAESCMADAAELEASSVCLIPALSEQAIKPPSADDIRGWFEECHNDTMGHGGFHTTLRHLVQNGRSWPTLRTDLRRLIRHCPTCQKARVPFRPGVRGFSSLAVDQPFTEVAVDFMGPFPADVDGNKYILVFVDHFSRYTELFATKDCSSLSAARGMLQVFGRYGAPRRLRSDNGSSFTADVISHFMALTTSIHKFTTPYRHQSNGVVERINGEVLRHLRALVYDREVRDTWSLFLPLIQRTVNSMVSESTGLSPSQLIYGGFVDPHQGLLTVPPVPMPVGFTHDDYYAALVAAQMALSHRASVVQSDIVAQRHAAMDAHVPVSFDLGELVILSHRDKRPTKLSCLQGPFIVVARPKPHTYTLEHMASGKVIDAADVTQVTLYHYDPDMPLADRDQAAEEAARKDRADQFTVEAITAHRFAVRSVAGVLTDKPANFATSSRSNESRLKHSYFRVRWLGYGPHEDSWEPFSNVRDCGLLNQFVLAHPELRLVL